MSLAPGTRLGPYEIVAPIGAGGMGEVYRVRDTKLKREVALKVLPDAFAQDAERMARFEREAQVLASLNHPHIAAIYGIEESNGIRALVMELVEGPTLAERIDGRTMSIDEALPIAKQIAEALENAHEKGIIHRDLKPANVKLTGDGTAKVLDFGLAKALEEPALVGNPSVSPTLTLEGTRAGVILGTAAYMSPEQARGATADKRADIWAFGCVLYEILTGKPVFHGETTSDILAAVLKSEPDWSALPATTPPRIRKLLKRCLERERKQRMQAIGEARIAIDAPEELAPLPATPRLWPWAVAAVFATAFSLAAVGWWHATRSAPLHALVRLTAKLPLDTAILRFVTGDQLALSPDGTRVAAALPFAGSKYHLVTRRLDQDQFVPLSGTEGASMPFFSPDGQWIAFFAEGKLKKVAVQGGSPVTLCEAPGFPFGASWGDDDNIIAAFNGGTTGLVRVPSDGGAPTSVTMLSKERGERAHGWPQVLPGSRTVLFTSSMGSFADANIDILSFQTGRRKTLHRGGFFGRYLATGYLVDMHQNTLFAAPFDLGRLAVTGAAQPVLEDVSNVPSLGSANFDFSQSGTFVYLSSTGDLPWSIFWLDSAGNTQPLHLTPGFYYCPRFSPDGKRLAFFMNDGQGHSDIWVRDLERDTTSRLTSMGAFWPSWTPDGKNIVFSSRDSPAPGIYSTRADGSSEPEQLTQAIDTLASVSLSLDGKRLAYSQRRRGGPFEIWTAPVEGDRDNPRLGKAELFLQTPFIELDSAFSPDGQWLAYSSDDTGTSEIYVRPFPGPGSKSQISTGYGRFPIWSRSGRELFFIGSGQRIMVAGYTVNRDSFVAAKPEVWSQRSLVTQAYGPYDLAPDGKRFAVLLHSDRIAEQEQKPTDSVTVLLNFFDELRRRVSANK